MKKVSVAVVGNYKGVFREWEYLGGKKIRLYRSDMPYQQNKNRYKDFSVNNVRFVKIWAYNKIEWVFIRWFKKTFVVPYREWKTNRIVKQNSRAMDREDRKRKLWQ